VAKDVRVEGKGKTVTATTCVFNDDRTMVGMGFLMGATFRFEEDGLWRLTFPTGRGGGR